jgi:Lar family restriction alleviation protein
MTAELKPCPMCGGNAALYPVAKNDPGALVRCIRDECGLKTRMHPTNAVAIAAWNKRAVDDDPTCYCPCHEEDECGKCCERFRSEEGNS